MMEVILEWFCKIVDSFAYVDVSKASKQVKRNYLIILGMFIIVAFFIRWLVLS